MAGGTGVGILGGPVASLFSGLIEYRLPGGGPAPSNPSDPSAPLSPSLAALLWAPRPPLHTLGLGAPRRARVLWRWGTWRCGNRGWGGWHSWTDPGKTPPPLPAPPPPGLLLGRRVRTCSHARAGRLSRWAWGGLGPRAPWRAHRQWVPEGRSAGDLQSGKRRGAQRPESVSWGDGEGLRGPSSSSKICSSGPQLLCKHLCGLQAPPVPALTQREATPDSEQCSQFLGGGRRGRLPEAACGLD